MASSHSTTSTRRRSLGKNTGRGVYLSQAGWYLALFAEENFVSHIRILLRQWTALCFHALHVGLVR
jgi:hypothetical protein